MNSSKLRLLTNCHNSWLGWLIQGVGKQDLEFQPTTTQSWQLLGVVDIAAGSGMQKLHQVVKIVQNTLNTLLWTQGTGHRNYVLIQAQIPKSPWMLHGSWPDYISLHAHSAALKSKYRINLCSFMRKQKLQSPFGLCPSQYKVASEFLTLPQQLLDLVTSLLLLCTFLKQQS